MSSSPCAGRSQPAKTGPHTRRETDRRLFDQHSSALVRKDSVESSRWARRARLEATVAGLPLSATTRLLEIGCGAGFAAACLGGRYRSYLGIDHSSLLVDEARRRHRSPATEFVSAPVEELELPAMFDIALMIGVLHHLEHPVKVLERVAGWLTPGGVVAANEPRAGNPVVSALRAIRRRVDPSYSEEQVFFTTRQLEGMFSAAGMVDVTARAQGFVSTPFAEVPLGSTALAVGCSRVAVAIDRWLERQGWPVVDRLSWNAVVVGRAPQEEVSGSEGRST